MENSKQKLEEQDFMEYHAIEKALHSYVSSAKTGNGAGLKEDWFEHSKVVGSLDGNPVNMSRDEFASLIDTLGGSPDVQHRISWIDYQGNAAVARIDFLNWGGVRYTDFLILYKEKGQWKVSGKVYDSHSRN